jgi:hypothetical protein
MSATLGHQAVPHDLKGRSCEHRARRDISNARGHGEAETFGPQQIPDRDPVYRIDACVGFISIPGAKRGIYATSEGGP